MRRALFGLLGAMLLASCSTSEAARLARGEPPPLGGTLVGGPWLVEDLNGGRMVASVRVDLTFDPGDAGTSRVTGRSGCNRFTGDWQQNGAAVKFGPLASTRMGCAPALMEFEGKFLTTLEAVTIVAFDASGAALLKASDGRAIKLRRAKP
ncbi:hypothetical protein GCM10007973_15120 [Polymorphobacter multimanifer]|uniref:Heat shock protein HslJ n=1 Tax=Polymorphobacter multimanifer TaxID=1070431 RepID=A0A841LB21_9SPHN|nr:META domain-containing protein [Polymorphobacter multimanifer]MBB6226208.1 heat shock protein HslJ [Polymorphobacter multimanifer]GGI79524.1 hypothetical protein GCM10007973_15120 [Polymorphobacter multimanifer]